MGCGARQCRPGRGGGFWPPRGFWPSGSTAGSSDGQRNPPRGLRSYLQNNYKQLDHTNNTKKFLKIISNKYIKWILKILNEMTLLNTINAREMI